ncbi:hypothetical protein NVP2275O_148 [Vibrio phage 2.275.O._10N.286.54.E11]|nr:hypothetical protein NVP2275O_148 [Vibrio phage 2.275.O._10N.286.54.E11]
MTKQYAYKGHPYIRHIHNEYSIRHDNYYTYIDTRHDNSYISGWTIHGLYGLYGLRVELPTL